ncbi:MAG TPA: HlyD family efflux transporter periplasmic adaptor subunit [Candidatus Paceibacterota bacterium]|nr:HlyD family efflux transporter periplasmic adaptor subunit [Candidatus Paceibacterota bacterium]
MSDQNERKIAETESQILETEKKILGEEKSIKKKLGRRAIAEMVVLGFIVAGAAAGAYWWLVINREVYTDNAQISAPLIQLSPDTPGVLKQLMVNEGDKVDANTPVARIGDGYLMTRTSGVIVSVSNVIGALVSPGDPVVTMINPSDLRVVASIDEDKGFSDVRLGERAEFTVDAFGSQKFEGVVDEIAQTSHQSSVVFSISDKREVQQFDVKIKYDTSKYPQLLNGMSARVWIYKN